MTDRARITPCLWFDGNAREAAPVDYPAGHEGDEPMVEFTVPGMPFIGLNGGPEFSFTEAVSFQVHTGDQAETDRYREAIVGDGGSESRCGWCRDRFGLSWQITPRALTDATTDPDRAAARRAMAAMMTMTRIDIAAIERARAGTAGDGE